MWRLLSLCVLACCLASGLAWRGNAAPVPMPNPDDGAVRNGIFTNEYFNLSYPLPSGWTEAIAGPAPSQSGYYVLRTFVPAGELTGTILIAAQDSFFVAAPYGDAMAMARELGRTMSAIDGMIIDQPPSEVQIAGRRYGRIDFSGVGLLRSTLITDIRCHFVSFNLTAKSPQLLATLVLSLNNLGFVDDRGAARADPTCAGNYVDSEHLVSKVDPAAVAPLSIPIPVRIVIGADGGVEHVHVIRATSDQRDSIERALSQWRFKPRETDGSAAEIETGLLLNFTPGGAINYPRRNPGARNGPG
jgi:hypothetical protein